MAGMITVFINVTGRRTDRISMIIKEVLFSIMCLIINLAALVILLATLIALLSGYVVVQFLSICSSAVSSQLMFDICYQKCDPASSYIQVVL